jgi:hypothetical protein
LKVRLKKELAAKPEPVMLTVAPGGPLVTSRARSEVMVKVTGSALPTVTERLPAGRAGTVKEPLTDPSWSDLRIVLSSCAPNRTWMFVRLTSNPSPVTVTSDPTGPLRGDNVTPDSTVKVAVASSTRTVFDPEPDQGTGKLLDHGDRDAPTVIEPIVLPSKKTV